MIACAGVQFLPGSSGGPAPTPVSPASLMPAAPLRGTQFSPFPLLANQGAPDEVDITRRMLTQNSATTGDRWLSNFLSAGLLTNVNQAAELIGRPFLVTRFRVRNAFSLAEDITFTWESSSVAIPGASYTLLANQVVNVDVPLASPQRLGAGAIISCRVNQSGTVASGNRYYSLALCGVYLPT